MRKGFRLQWGGHFDGASGEHGQGPGDCIAPSLSARLEVDVDRLSVDAGIHRCVGDVSSSRRRVVFVSMFRTLPSRRQGRDGQLDVGNCSTSIIGDDNDGGGGPTAASAQSGTEPRSHAIEREETRVPTHPPLSSPLPLVPDVNVNPLYWANICYRGFECECDGAGPEVNSNAKNVMGVFDLETLEMYRPPEWVGSSDRGADHCDPTIHLDAFENVRVYAHAHAHARCDLPESPTFAARFDGDVGAPVSSSGRVCVSSSSNDLLVCAQRRMDDRPHSQRQKQQQPSGPVCQVKARLCAPGYTTVCDVVELEYESSRSTPTSSTPTCASAPGILWTPLPQSTLWICAWHPLTICGEDAPGARGHGGTTRLRTIHQHVTPRWWRCIRGSTVPVRVRVREDRDELWLLAHFENEFDKGPVDRKYFLIICLDSRSFVVTSYTTPFRFFDLVGSDEHCLGFDVVRRRCWDAKNAAGVPPQEPIPIATLAATMLVFVVSLSLDDDPRVLRIPARHLRWYRPGDVGIRERYCGMRPETASRTAVGGSSFAGARARVDIALSPRMGQPRLKQASTRRRVSFVTCVYALDRSFEHNRPPLLQRFRDFLMRVRVELRVHDLHLFIFCDAVSEPPIRTAIAEMHLGRLCILSVVPFDRLRAYTLVNGTSPFPVLPRKGHDKKDTAEFLMLINSKLEFVQRARDVENVMREETSRAGFACDGARRGRSSIGEHVGAKSILNDERESDMYMFVDAGITYLPGSGDELALCVNAVRDIPHTITNDDVLIPGYDRRHDPSITTTPFRTTDSCGGDDHPLYMAVHDHYWRFLGGVICVGRNAVDAICRAHLETLDWTLRRTACLSWEVNVWALMEVLNPDLRIKWIRARFDRSIIRCVTEYWKPAQVHCGVEPCAD